MKSGACTPVCETAQTTSVRSRGANSESRCRASSAMASSTALSFEPCFAKAQASMDSCCGENAWPARLRAPPAGLRLPRTARPTWAKSRSAGTSRRPNAQAAFARSCSLNSPLATREGAASAISVSREVSRQPSRARAHATVASCCAESARTPPPGRARAAEAIASMPPPPEAPVEASAQAAMESSCPFRSLARLPTASAKAEKSLATAPPILATAHAALARF
mmetsp:Transcript_40992/g.127944  ORF Transcript_40992/g.127944 Transcript_40992/m.127944 type:complete len:223 (-) Transcript_40992:209-877(-)